MRFSLFVIILLIVIACKKDSYKNVRIVGHAGNGLSIASSIYHDNSYESVQYVLGLQGVEGVEVDVQISADGTAWLFHDLSLEGETTGTGCINSSTDEYLEFIRYRGFNQEKLLRLSEIHFPFETHQLFLDIRNKNECSGAQITTGEIMNGIASALPGYTFGHVCVITTREDWIGDFYNAGWNIFYEVTDPDLYTEAADSTFDRTTGTCFRFSAATARKVDKIREMGKQVILFDVRSAKNIRRALKMSPDILLADDVKGTLIQKY